MSRSNTPQPLSPPITVPIELKNLLAGGLSGMLSKSIVAPLDRIKILYQVTSVPFYVRNVPSVVAGIVRTEGVAALWRGNTATMVRIFPYAGVQFMVFGRMKVYCAERRRKTGDDGKWGMRPMESLVAGSCAGAVSVLCTYPLDLTRAQLAVSKKRKVGKGEGNLGGKTHGFIHVLKGNYTKGGVQGLFRGITPTMLGILPYAGIAFTINEQAKRQIYNLTNRDPTTMEKIQCGALSGLIAQSATYPLEVTRRRMQTVGMIHPSGNDTAVGLLSKSLDITSKNNTTPSPSPSSFNISRTPPRQPPTTMLCIMKEVVTEQGIRGFYKGLTMNWLKGPVSFAISFTAFDILQGWMEAEEEGAVRSGGLVGRNTIRTQASL